MPELGFATRALYDAREQVRDAAPRLRALWGAIGMPNDLSLSQAAHWFAVTMTYRPDLVIELGRGQGNSTAVFTEAANRLGQTRVKSFCFTAGWPKQREVARVVSDPDWFKPLELHSGNITRIDFAPHVQSAQRVLILWDAHGFEVSDAVLGHLLPLVADREHLVICHDISDNRVCAPPRDYGGRPSWRGMRDYDTWVGTPGQRARVNLFWVNTIVDQAIAILDFCWRNDIELHSADYDGHCATAAHPEQVQAVRATWPEDLFQTCNHWVYFSLNECRGQRFFPTPTAASAVPAPERDPAAELRAVYNSFSWKLTAPLRALGRVFGMK
jgi:hypothetical protein